MIIHGFVPFPIGFLGVASASNSYFNHGEICAITVELSQPYLVGYQLASCKRRGILPSKVMPLGDGITKPIGDHLEHAERLSFSHNFVAFNTP